MGARVVRMMRNFNLENRVFREISREKPQPAPRHATEAPAAAASSEAGTIVDPVNQKNDPLLALLKSVYVESKDPAAQEPKGVTQVKEAERRPLRFSLPGDPYGLVGLTDVPKGKLTIAEALKAVSSHQRQPQTWTPEKVAQEYSLELKDTKDLLEFFIPFQVQIIPPKTDNTKQIKASSD
ncbi:NADH dehydrogenase [ubiquinone] 1 alpha subcomplex assembly factor 4 isoform X2 [Echeneis naucrates]|uniref:NADH dehydrogenase [ubiquinone] 1 alpha subcomplex assembly factor 4 n=1 Tax=Echeneis naucrates TaxID=173247 RepID=A0A665W0F4_ECHNA|nr:NADH dehydrogenase [ubiquinone] 1 alpha subcomplex assembly factor 4 isoform X2 [Echeneis naucrates]